MTQFPFSIVGFDLDGTLVDSAGDIANAVNHALATIDRPPLARDAIAAMVGGGARRLIRLALEAGGGVPTEFEAVHARYLDHYAAHLAEETRPYPGAIEAVDALRALGVCTAVVTNKVERLAIRLLDRLGILGRFDLVLGGDTLGPGTQKPSPAMLDALVARLGGGRAILIGDSPFDIGAAQAAGIPSIRFDPTGLATAIGADATIARFDALLPLLARWDQTGR